MALLHPSDAVKLQQYCISHTIMLYVNAMRQSKPVQIRRMTQEVSQQGICTQLKGTAG